MFTNYHLIYHLFVDDRISSIGSGETRLGEQTEEYSGDEDLGVNPNNFLGPQLLSEASSSLIKRERRYGIYGEEPIGLVDTELSSVIESHSEMDHICQKKDFNLTMTPFICPVTNNEVRLTQFRVLIHL